MDHREFDVAISVVTAVGKIIFAEKVPSLTSLADIKTWLAPVCGVSRFQQELRIGNVVSLPSTCLRDVLQPGLGSPTRPMVIMLVVVPFNRECMEARSFRLHRCVQHGDKEAVERLLEIPISPDEVNPDVFDASPLHLAAWRGNVAVMALLCEAGANKEKRVPPRLFVAGNGIGGMAFPLDDENYSKRIDDQLDGATALWLAVRNNQIEAVRLLVRLGANKNGSTKMGYTALNVAATLGYLEIVEFLCKAKANMEKAPGASFGTFSYATPLFSSIHACLRQENRFAAIEELRRLYSIGHVLRKKGAPRLTFMQALVLFLSHDMSLPLILMMSGLYAVLTLAVIQPDIQFASGSLLPIVCFGCCRLVMGQNVDDFDDFVPTAAVLMLLQVLTLITLALFGFFYFFGLHAVTYGFIYLGHACTVAALVLIIVRDRKRSLMHRGKCYINYLMQIQRGICPSSWKLHLAMDIDDMDHVPDFSYDFAPDRAYRRHDT